MHARIMKESVEITVKSVGFASFIDPGNERSARDSMRVFEFKIPGAPVHWLICLNSAFREATFDIVRQPHDKLSRWPLRGAARLHVFI